MTAENELFAYVQTPDNSFMWRQTGNDSTSDVTITQLHLTSQTWQGAPWSHRIEIFVPAQLREPEIVFLYVETPPGAGQRDFGSLLAQHTGLVCAFLSDIPNQPLFGDLIEDALIAHTFVQFLDTGDPSWPLLFPMVKSVVRAMDVIQEFAAQQATFTARKFAVSGASKRGWTTWLTAAVDSRVAGIAPMVYDNLNLAAQMPHQVEVFDGYSDQISDYTEQGLPQRMQTPEGMHLAQVVDPYTYRDRLTMPKLIINGANDSYWATDAINLYWDDLPGLKHILDIPNVGHSLSDPQRLFSTLAAFLNALAGAIPLPRLDWFFDQDKDTMTLIVATDAPTSSAHCWIAGASGRDFRRAEWTPTPMALQEATSPHIGIYTACVDLPASGHIAVYGEVEFSADKLPYTLSTQMYISPPR